MTTKLGELKSKLGEYESTIRDHESAISSAKSKCDEWTRSDVGKIQREFWSIFRSFLFPAGECATAYNRAYKKGRITNLNLGQS